MKEVMEYFGMQVATFRKEWAQLSEKDKTDLKNGVKNGTLTY